MLLNKNKKHEKHDKRKKIVFKNTLSVFYGDKNINP